MIETVSGPAAFSRNDWQPTGVAMIWAGIIQDLAYERGGQKLFVLFDSQRRVLFHHVPEDLWAQLSNPATRDSVLALNILGQFAWSDLGIRLPDAADSSR